MGDAEEKCGPETFAALPGNADSKAPVAVPGKSIKVANPKFAKRTGVLKVTKKPGATWKVTVKTGKKTKNVKVVFKGKVATIKLKKGQKAVVSVKATAPDKLSGPTKKWTFVRR